MKIVKSILSFLSIAVLLTSVMGVSISRHYCMGMLKHEHFFSTAEVCAAEQMMHCHHEEGDDAVFIPNCCEDEYIAIPGLDVESQLKEHGAVSFVPAPFQPNLFIYRAPMAAQAPLSWDYAPNPPPLPGRQLLVQQQRFLI